MNTLILSLESKYPIGYSPTLHIVKEVTPLITRERHVDRFRFDSLDQETIFRIKSYCEHYDYIVVLDGKCEWNIDGANILNTRHHGDLAERDDWIVCADIESECVETDPCSIQAARLSIFQSIFNCKRLRREHFEMMEEDASQYEKISYPFFSAILYHCYNEILERSSSFGLTMKTKNRGNILI